MSTPAEMTGVQRHAQAVVREMARLQDEADRMTRRCQMQEAALREMERRVYAVMTLKSWTNEDGKRFVFADDLAETLGYGPSVAARTAKPDTEETP